jgi:hypothetical protein
MVSANFIDFQLFNLLTRIDSISHVSIMTCCHTCTGYNAQKVNLGPCISRLNLHQAVQIEIFRGEWCLHVVITDQTNDLFIVPWWIQVHTSHIHHITTKSKHLVHFSWFKKKSTTCTRIVVWSHYLNLCELQIENK